MLVSSSLAGFLPISGGGESRGKRGSSHSKGRGEVELVKHILKLQKRGGPDIDDGDMLGEDVRLRRNQVVKMVRYIKIIGYKLVVEGDVVLTGERTMRALRA